MLFFFLSANKEKWVEGLAPDRLVLCDGNVYIWLFNWLHLARRSVSRCVLR